MLFVGKQAEPFKQYKDSKIMLQMGGGVVEDVNSKQDVVWHYYDTV